MIVVLPIKCEQLDVKGRTVSELFAESFTAFAHCLNMKDQKNTDLRNEANKIP